MSKKHKLMGFGLPRIYSTSINFDGYLGYDHNFGLLGYRQYLESKGERFASEIKTIDALPHIDFSDCVHYTTRTITITPPQMICQWHRCGDVFDRAESEIDGATPNIQMLPHGIPGFRFLEDQSTGRKISATVATLFFDLYDKYLSETCDAVKLAMEGTLAELASDMGYGTIDDATRRVVPYVPEVVKQFCYYLNIFRDDAQVDHLKPMLCVFWR